jgi:hypothetical protein
MKFKKFKLLLILVFFKVALINNVAFAYLDPMTTNTILQFIILAFATVVSFVSIFFLKVKNFFRGILKLFSKKSKKNT